MSRPTRRALLVGLAALPLAGISSFEALFAPRSDLWDRWTRHDPAATARIWPSELGTNRWLSATRLRPKARATNSTAMSSLRLNER